MAGEDVCGHDQGHNHEVLWLRTWISTIATINCLGHNFLVQTPNFVFFIPVEIY